MGGWERASWMLRWHVAKGRIPEPRNPDEALRLMAGDIIVFPPEET
jgi:hypothetical protein